MSFKNIYDIANKKGIEASKSPSSMGSGYVYIKVYAEFAKWAKEEGLTKSDPSRGTVIVVSDMDKYGDVVKKEAYAEAFSKELKANGIRSVAGSYLT